MKTSTSKLRKKAYLNFFLALVIIVPMLFLPSGSLAYWEGWVYLGVIFLPMIFIVEYFLAKDPALLERRMKMKEKEHTQKNIMRILTLFFLIGFLMPGFDYRFHWSNVPLWLIILSNIIVFIGYMMIFRVFKENSYASRIIEVEKDQKVISSGPYGVIRHPMYAAAILMYMFTPLALGSYWALIPFLFLFPPLILRILNEEKLLIKELPGYKEYCEKIKYRLIPFIW